MPLRIPRKRDGASSGLLSQRPASAAQQRAMITSRGVAERPAGQEAPNIFLPRVPLPTTSLQSAPPRTKCIKPLGHRLREHPEGLPAPASLQQPRDGFVREGGVKRGESALLREKRSEGGGAAASRQSVVGAGASFLQSRGEGFQNLLWASRNHSARALAFPCKAAGKHTLVRVSKRAQGLGRAALALALAGSRGAAQEMVQPVFSLYGFLSSGMPFTSGSSPQRASMYCLISSEHLET